jgi:thioredoxin/glutathione reductase (selenoprotein)
MAAMALRGGGGAGGEGGQYDLAVIGGGSGGLACAKEAARLGAKVALFDYVSPSPAGTAWGFGGTCVNVGCIPKKLFHYGALLGEGLHDARKMGWSGVVDEHVHGKHNWEELVGTVRNYVKKLNFSYRNGARAAGVEYINAKASFAAGSEKVVEYTLKGERKSLTASNVLIAVGGRPFVPPMRGAELAITSDDIFYRTKVPGRTLVVGGGYIAMECAGFLTGLGYPVSLAVRSKPLRAFDGQMADKITEIMREAGTKFLIGRTPAALAQAAGGRIAVEFDDGSKDTFDTVLVATGRAPDTAALNAPKHLAVDAKSGKFVADVQTNLVKGSKSVYAVGDCLLGAPELTPVAIRDGETLAKRLFGPNKKLFFNKDFIPTTVFTPSEYGTVGLSQEEAEARLGKSKVECFLYDWPTLERACVHREKHPDARKDDADVDAGNNCMAKLVCEKLPGDFKVVGWHFIGPNAGEVTQGFALAVKMGVKKVSGRARRIAFHFSLRRLVRRVHAPALTLSDAACLLLLLPASACLV